MKQFLAGCAALFCACALFALPQPDETPWNLSIQPFFGLRYGEVGEYVFLKNSNYSDDKLSELDWEIKPSVYLGAKIEGGWKAINGSTYVSFAIPKNTGKMIDSDWLNNNPSYYPPAEAAYDYKTNYTESDNYLKQNYSFGFDGGYTFTVFQNLKITPKTAFDYTFIKFTAKGAKGYYGYTIKDYKKDEYYSGPWYASNDTKNRYSVNINNSRSVVSYERSTYLFWLGLQVAYQFPKSICAALSFQVAPYTYCYNVDKHLARNQEFTDITYGFFAAFKGALEVSYKIDERNSVVLNGTFFRLNTIRGNSYDTTNSSKVYSFSDSEGGASEYAFDFSLSWKFSIF